MKPAVEKFFYPVKQAALFAVTLLALVAIGIQNRLWKVR